MSLLAPWFLLGGLAVGLPLWLHLLERENPTRLPFSSLMFFERRRQSSLKEKRFRYRALMALRIAFCSCCSRFLVRQAGLGTSRRSRSG